MTSMNLIEAGVVIAATALAAYVFLRMLVSWHARKVLPVLIERRAEQLAKKAREHYVEALHSATPESLAQRNRDLIDAKVKLLLECESHLQDLELAYMHDRADRIAHCRTLVESSLGEAQAYQPSFVPFDKLCTAHAAFHAPDEIAARLNAMASAYAAAQNLRGMRR